jgi:hypothetical protein
MAPSPLEHTPTYYIQHMTGGVAVSVPCLPPLSLTSQPADTARLRRILDFVDRQQLANSRNGAYGGVVRSSQIVSTDWAERDIYGMYGTTRVWVVTRHDEASRSILSTIKIKQKLYDDRATTV